MTYDKAQPEDIGLRWAQSLVTDAHTPTQWDPPELVDSVADFLVDQTELALMLCHSGRPGVPLDYSKMPPFGAALWGLLLLAERCGVDLADAWARYVNEGHSSRRDVAPGLYVPPPNAGPARRTNLTVL